jgi:opacity protein-like surface antigen
MKIKQTCMAILILSAATAQAQWYGEIGVTPLSVKGTVEGNTLKSHPTMIGIVAGYEFHPNFAVEGMAGTNVDSDPISLNGSEVAGTSLKVNRAYGVFIKPKVMLTPELELFGRLGVVDNKTTGQVGNLSITDTDHDFAYGAGISYHFDKTTYGSLGYSNFYDKHGTTTRGATLSVGMKF